MSLLLDTNVVSELKRGRNCHPQVRDWHAAQVRGQLWLSVATIAEVRKGVEKLRSRDPGRAAGFAAWLDTLTSDFGGRIIGVDLAVADRWGRLLAQGNTPPNRRAPRGHGPRPRPHAGDAQCQGHGGHGRRAGRSVRCGLTGRRWYPGLENVAEALWIGAVGR